MSNFRGYPSSQASLTIYDQDHIYDDTDSSVDQEYDDDSSSSSEDNPVEYLDKFIRQNSFDEPMDDENSLDEPSSPEIHHNKNNSPFDRVYPDAM